KTAGINGTEPNLYRAADKANDIEATRAPRVANGEVRCRQRSHRSSIIASHGNRYGHWISCSSANKPLSHHRLYDESCHARHCNKPPNRNHYRECATGIRKKPEPLPAMSLNRMRPLLYSCDDQELMFDEGRTRQGQSADRRDG